MLATSVELILKHNHDAFDGDIILACFSMDPVMCFARHAVPTHVMALAQVALLFCSI